VCLLFVNNVNKTYLPLTKVNRNLRSVGQINLYMYLSLL